MKIGVFQFAGSGDINANCQSIVRGMQLAADAGVRLLVFQECALCGYPPIETDIEAIDYAVLETCLNKIKAQAKALGLYIALGAIYKEADKRYNSILLLSPEGAVTGRYDKRALWGWDIENFQKDAALGIFEIEGVKVGFRICFEVRFPEYFRELFLQQCDLCFVSFCDVSDTPSQERYDTIKAHLITRAVENAFPIVSVNSCSHCQTAPTAVFDENGGVIKEAPPNEECLLVYEFEKPMLGYGARGRVQISKELLGI